MIFAIFKYATYLPISLIMVALAFILSPFLSAYSVIFNKTNLPGILINFQTIDDDLDGGEHQLNWPKVTGFKLWWQRTCWICRNPAMCFQSNVIGIKQSGTIVKNIVEKGDASTPYFFERNEFIINGKIEYFEYRRQIPWYSGSSHFIIFWIGWDSHGPGTKTFKYKLSFNPWKSF